MHRKQLKRLASGLAAASLLTVAMAVPTVAAPPGGSSRSISVASTGAANGLITVTPVTAPGLAQFDVVVKNDGRQTFTNANLTIGEQGPGTNSYDLPVAFNEGTTIESFSAVGFACERDEAKTLLTCDLGNIAARSPEGTVSIVLDVPITSTLSIRAAVKGAERTNDGGSSSNIDTFVAVSGNVVVSEETCDSRASYLKANSDPLKSFGTCPDLVGSNVQSTTIRIPGSLATALAVSEGTCPASFTCVGQESTANLTAAYEGLVEWEIKVALASRPDLSKLVVSHYPDGSDTADLTLVNTKKSYCRTKSSGDCLVEVSWSNSTNTLTVILRTFGNGKTRLLG